MHKIQFAFYILLLFSSHLQAQESSASFARKEIGDDLAFLKLSLEKYHPNLYQYSDPQIITQFFEDLTDTIREPLNNYEAFRLIASTSKVVKDGHYTFTPNPNTLNEFYSTSKLLPLDLYFDTEQTYVLRNYSNEEEIMEGQKIISINGISINEIQGVILDCVLRDGNNKTYPRWIFNNFLRAYYGFCFGESSAYFIGIEDPTGGKREVKIKGMNYQEIKQARKKKYPDYNHVNTTKLGLSITIDQKQHIARINIPTFDKDILKNTYQQKFKPIIKDFMHLIHESDTEYLIIDIRGNQGGEVSNANFLLKHLFKEPFISVLSHQKVDKRNYTDINNRLKKANSSVDGIMKPIDKNNYEGKIFLLTNGGSFSASGIFAQALHKYKRATLIGEETGGNAYTLVGQPDKKIVLPNTKIQVNIPRVRFNLNSEIPKKTSGAIPDIKTAISINDLLQNKDVDYEKTLELINNEK